MTAAIGVPRLQRGVLPRFSSSRLLRRAAVPLIWLISFSMCATAAVPPIQTDGRTQTVVQTAGSVTNVTTSTLVGNNGLNSFTRFNVDSGTVVNLFVPVGADTLLNLVSGETSQINGLLNSIKDGKIGGNVYFLNPHGVIIGASGAVNVGSLTMVTPAQGFVDGFFDDSSASVTQALAGTVPLNPSGTIVVQGKVSAARDIKVSAGAVTNAGSVLAGAVYQGTAPDFSDVVNVGGLASGAGVAMQNGNITILAAGDVVNRGTIAADGGSGVNAGAVTIKAGSDVVLEAGSVVSARGHGDGSSGGETLVYAGRNAEFAAGATIDTRGGEGSGDGGNIEFSAADTVTLAGGRFDASAASGKAGNVLIDPNNIEIVADNVLTGGSAYTLAANNSITVNSGVTISTRSIGAGTDQVTAVSAGNSGDITLTAPTITVGTNAKLLSQVILNAGDTFTAGDITLTGENITLGSGAQLLSYSAMSDGTRLTAGQTTKGNITLTATQNDHPGALEASASAGITIDGATLKGRDITASVTADAGYEWEGDPASLVTRGAETLARSAIFMMSGVQVGVASSSGTSELLVNNGSTLDAEGKVDLTATTTSHAELMTLGLGAFTANQLFNVGFVYGHADATATVDVKSGATIKGTDLSLAARNDANLDVNVYGFSTAQEANAAVAVTDAQVHSTAQIASGATVNVSGNVTVRAVNNNSFNTGATAMALEQGSVGVAAAITNLDTGATAANGANLSGVQNVTIDAADQITHNKVGSTGTAGSGSVIGKTLVPVLKAGDSVVNWVSNKLSGGQGGLNPATGATEKPKLAAAVTYAENVHQADASLGANVTVDAAKDVVVSAEVSDELIRAQANSDVEGKAGDPNNPGASLSLSAAVLVGLYDHDATANIGAGATVKGQHIGVRSDVSLPYEITWHKWEGLSTILSKLNGNLGLANGLVTGFANAQSSSSGFGLAGAVSYLDFQNDSTASVDRSAHLVVKPGGTAAWSSMLGSTDPAWQERFDWSAPVNVDAAVDVSGVFAAGNISLLLNGAGGAGGATSVGGAYGQVNYANTAKAYVAEGAVIESDTGAPAVDVAVEASNDSDLIGVAPSAGRGASYGANLIFSLATINDTTEASVDDEAKITAQKLLVDADEDVMAWSLAGTFASGESAGVGAGVAMNDVTTNTRAFIGDNDSNNSDGSKLSATDGQVAAADVDVLARTDGRIESISVAGAMASSDNPKSPSDPPGFLDKLKALLPSALTKLGSKTGSNQNPTQPKFGLAVSGSASVNETSLTTSAYVEKGKLDLTSGAATSALSLSAVNDTDITAASGSASLVRANATSSSFSAGIAGSVAVNDLTNGTSAYVKDATVTGAHDVSVDALAGGDQLAIAIGAAVNASADKSKAAEAAGSVSVSETQNTVSARIVNSTLTGVATGTSRDLQVTAYDRTRLGTGGGSLIAGGKGGIGAAVTYSSIANTSEAYLSKATVTGYDDARVKGLSSTQIAAGGAMAGLTTESASLTLGGAVVVSEIANTTSAEIKDGSSITTTGTVEVLAKDTAPVTALDTVIDSEDEGQTAVDGLDYKGAGAGAAAPGASSIVSVAGVAQVGGNNVGISFVWNSIKNTYKASVAGSSLDAATVDVKAQSGASIFGLSAGAGVALGQFAGGGSVTVNEIENATTAEVTGTGQTIKAGSVTVQAEDDSKIDSLAGQVTISGGAASIGGAVADNQIGNTTKASVTDVNLDASTAATIKAVNASTIRTLSAAGGGSSSIALNGSVSSSRITNTTEAALVSAKSDETGAAVQVLADDESSISALSGAAAFSGTGAVGAAVAVNRVANTTKAHVSSSAASSLYDVGSLLVRSDSESTIKSLAVGVGGSVNVGVAGSVATNFITSTNDSYIDSGAKVRAQSNVGVVAETDDAVTNAAGSVAIGVTAAGVGASVTVNNIGGSTKAYISGTGTEVTALAKDATQKLTVAAGGLSNSVDLADGLDLTSYGRTDLSAARVTEEVTGVAVNSSATHSVENITANVAGGQYLGLAGTTNVNVIGGDTEAYVDTATINASLPETAGAGQGLSVKASDHAYANDFVGTLAVGAAGVGLGVDTNVFSRDTRAYVKNSSEVRSAGATTVDAESTQGVSSLVASGSAGVVGVVGTGTVGVFNSTTEAYLLGTTAHTGSLSVDADHQSRLFVAAGGVTVGAGAVAGTFVVGKDNSTTLAYVDSTTVDTTGAVNVAAEGTTEIQSWGASGAAAGAVGIAGNVVVSLVDNTTQAYVKNNSHLGRADRQVGSVSVTALDRVTIDNKAGSVAVGLAGMGLGAGASVTSVDNTTSAYLEDSDVYTSGGATIDAQAERDLSSIAVSLGVGGTVGIGGTAAVTLVGRNLSGSVAGELNKGGDGTLAGVDDLTTGDRLSDGSNVATGTGLSADELNTANAAGKTGVTNTLTSGALSSRTTALVSGASTITAGGNVKVNASEKDQASINAGAGGLSLGASVGGSVGVMNITNNVEASVLGTSTITSNGGGIEVLAGTGKLSSSDAAASVKTYQGSAGLVALGASVATADLTNNVTAQAGRGTTLSVSGGAGKLAIEATDNTDVEAEARGFTAGLAAAGAVEARANKSGDVQALVGNTAASGAATALTSFTGGLTVRSARAGEVSAFTQGGSGGGISGIGSDAGATETGSVKTKIGNNVTLSGSGGAVQIEANAAPQVTATAQGFSGGYWASVGVSLANATASPNVEATIGSGGSITAGSLSLTALTRLSGAGPTAKTNAVAGVGGLLGINVNESNAQSNSTVKVEVGSALAYATGPALNVSGDVQILASNTTKEEAAVTGIVAGLVAVGANQATAKANSTTTATLENSVTGAVGGALAVGATGNDDTYAEATAGSGGLAAVGAAQADTKNTSTTTASLGGGDATGTLQANKIALNAQHTATFNGEADSIQASLVGGSGAVTTHDVDSTVEAKILDGAKLQTQDIKARAENDVRKPWLTSDSFNAYAGSGGLLNGAAASSQSDIDVSTVMAIGQNANIAVTGDEDNPGATDFTAVNDIETRDKTKLDTGGAITVARAESKIRVNKSDAGVSMGAGAILDSVGTVNFGARTRADVETSANAKTYGGAGAAEGASQSDIHTANTVVIGANASIRADGDVNLYAGRDSSGQLNNLRAVARTDLWNKTLLPIETSPAADASIDSKDVATALSQVSIAEGAKVRSVGDIAVIATRGTTLADGQGTGKDLYRELAAEIASAFSNLVGGGDVSLDVKGGSSHDAGTTKVTVDGTVHAGIQNKQRLVIDVNGNVVEQTEGVTYTLTNENLVTNLFNRLNQLTSLRAAYGLDPAASAAYDAEIAYVKRELAALGYSAQPNGDYLIRNLTADFINVADVKARGGDVSIEANYLTGIGSVKAPSDTEITIENNSQKFLRTGKLTIEDKGGHVSLNGDPLTSNVGSLTIEAAGTSSVTPSITVRNTYNPLGNGRPAPDIELTGDITNRTGTVTIDNLKGSVKLQGKSGKAAPSILADSIAMTAGRDIVQSYVDGFQHIGGAPESLYAWEQMWAELFKTDLTGTNYHPGTGGYIAGNNVFIAARHLNINGTIQSGIPDWSVYLDGSSYGYVAGGYSTDLNGYIAWAKQDWINRGRPSMANPASLNAYKLSGTSTGQVAAYFNPETNQIVLDNVEIRGGYVELFGEIMNTGGGKINVMDGYGRINVTNTTGYDIVINGLDNGNNISGIVRITDTGRTVGNVPVASGGRPITTVYERLGGQVWQSQYDGDTLLSQTNTGNARTGTYDPAANLRYVWTRGQSFQETFVGETWEYSALGFIPAGSSAYDSWSRTATSDVHALPNGMYTNTAGQATNYQYDYSNYDTTALTFVGRYDDSWWSWSDFSTVYYVRDTWVQGSQDVHTHSIKADYAIPVEFIGWDGGDANAAINVTSNGNVILAGSVKNTGGTATIKSNGGTIQQTAETAVVEGRTVTLETAKGLGSTLAPVNVRLVGDTGSLKATTTSGDINLRGTKGDVRVNLVSTGSGNVALNVEGNLVQALAGDTAVVQGNKVDLTSRSGDIGTATQSLNVQTGSDLVAGLNATAERDVFVRQPNGDFRIVRVTAGRDVKLEAAAGTIVDANPVVKKDERTVAELEKLWDEMLLTGADAEASADNTTKAYAQAKQAEYQEYWRRRNIKPTAWDADGKPTSFAADPYDAATADAEFQRLHAAYGGGTYDPSWTYVLTAAEQDSLTVGHAWTMDELTNGLSKGVFFKQVTYSETDDKAPNVKGRNITLLAVNGSVGTDNGQLTIDGNDPNALKDQTKRLALAAAEPDDIGVDVATKQITVLLRKSLKIDASGEVVVDAKDHVYLGSKEPIYVKTVASDGSIRIKGRDGLYSVATGGPANIQGGRTILEGGAGGIGTSTAPLTTQLQAGAQLTARSDQDMFIKELFGDLSIAEIYSKGSVNLTSKRSILDSRGERPIAIQGTGLNLTAQEGSVGTELNPLAAQIDAGGQLSAWTPSSGGVFVTSPRTLNLGDITSGRVTVETAGAELNLAGTIDATGVVDLTATGGVIAETGSGRIAATTLTTASSGGQTLDGANAVTTFTAENAGGGDVKLSNTASTLSVGNVTQTGGGNIALVNAGALAQNGTIITADDVALTASGGGAVTLNGAIDVLGTVTLTADSTITESALGKVLGAARLETMSTGGQTLTGANTVQSLAATNGGGGEVRLTNTAATLTIDDVTQSAGGSVTLTNAGALEVDGTLSTSGDVTLTASAGGGIQLDGTVDTPGRVVLSAEGSITEGALGKVLNAARLEATSTGGQTLDGANTVASFDATNAGDGDLRLTNTAGPLTITGVTQLAGGDVVVGNAGAIEVTGAIATADAVHLTSSGTITESGDGRVAQAAVLVTSSFGGQTLDGPNTVQSFTATNAGGDVRLTNTADPLTITGVTQLAGGDVVVGNTGAIEVTAAIATADAVHLTSSGTITESGDGRVAQAAALVTSSFGGQTLDGPNTVQSFTATNAGGDIRFTNTADRLTIAGVTQTASGDVVVDNTGAIELTGTIAGTDDVRLTASATITESGAGRVAGATALVTRSEGGQTLDGANTVASFDATNAGDGDLRLTNTAGPLTITGVTQLAGGDVVVGNTGAIEVIGAIATADAVHLTSSGTITESGDGRVAQAAALVTSSFGGQTLDGANTVQSFTATNAGGDVRLTNTADPLTIEGIIQTAGGDVVVTNDGALRVVSIVATGGDTILQATGSIVNGKVADPTANIESVNITLTSTGGAIGADGQHLAVDSSATAAGTVTALAAGDLYLTETAGDLRANTLESIAGDLTVVADGSILNRGAAGAANFRGRNLALTATGGSFGEAGNRVVTEGSGATDVTAASDLWLEERGGDLVSNLIQSQHGSVDLAVPSGGIDAGRISAATDLVMSAAGEISLDSVEAPRLAFRLPTAGATLDITEARVAERLTAQVDDFTIGSLIHTGATPLVVDLTGGSATMAQHVDIVAQSGVGIDFTRLVSDFTLIDAAVDSLRFFDLTVGSRAEIRNRNNSVIADNLERRLFDDYDLQLLPFHDAFYLLMGADRLIRTDARVVNYDDRFIANQFSTENSVVRLTEKLPKIVTVQPGLVFMPEPSGSGETTLLTEDGVNAEL